MGGALRSAVPAEIEIDGHRFRWSRLTLGDYRELERRYIASRPDPMACAREHLVGLSEGLQRRLLEIAFDAALEPAAPTVEELRRWLLGCEGLSAALELSVRLATPTVAAEQCRRQVYESLGTNHGDQRRATLLQVVSKATGISLVDSAHSGNRVDLGNERSRSAVVGASAVCEEDLAGDQDADQEPEWIGALYGTD
jgi:hypothetical protein